MKNPQQPNKLPSLPDRASGFDEEIAAEEEEDELEVRDKDIRDPDRDPELTNAELDDVTTWDENPDDSGSRAEATGFDDENDFPRQLVESGVDVADTEQRDERETDERVEEAEEEAAEAARSR